jgi:flagellar motor switch protein FliG
VPEVRKAAILLTCLPEEQAAQILARLSPKQAEAVTIQIARLGRLSPDETESVVREFAEANPYAFGGETGGVEVARSLVEKAFGDQTGGTLENLKHSLETLPFHFLKSVDPQTLLSCVSDEHPQTIALILAHLPPAYSAQIVKELPADRQLAVIRRIASMGPTSAEVIEEVEHGLENRLSNVLSRPLQQSGGVGSVAEILSVADRTTGRALMEHLAQEDPALVEEIRRQMFPFEDLGKLSDKDLQTVLNNVETSRWAMALKAASPDLLPRILGKMSQRAAALLQEQLERLGAVRLAEVEQAQQQIVDIVLRLEDAGAISVQAPEGDEEFVQ